MGTVSHTTGPWSMGSTFQKRKLRRQSQVPSLKLCALLTHALHTCFLSLWTRAVRGTENDRWEPEQCHDCRLEKF